MPSHDRLRPNQSDPAGDIGKQAMDPFEQQPIQAAKSNTIGHLPAQNAQLMPKNQDLSFEPSP